MSITAGAARAQLTRLPPAATVVGRDIHARRSAAQLLAAAGFGVAGEPAPGVLTVVVAQRRDDARLREIRALASAHPNAPLLAVVPASVPNASLRRVLLAGASGIVLDDDVRRALAPTARAILAGQLAVPASLVRQIAPRPLSHREKEALGLVVLGMTNREIASKLFLAESTVKTHLSSAFRKLDARSRSEAVSRILDPESGYGVGILRLADEPLAAMG